MKQIIIVEDDAGIVEPMTIILRNAGYHVSAFLDGNIILTNDYTLPDIFIIDKMLSGVDGIEICKYLKTREESKHIPVIMVSANPNIKRLAAEAMADDALEKPFRMQELRDIVVKHLAG